MKEKQAEFDDPERAFAEENDGEKPPNSSKGRKGGSKGRGRGRGRGKGRKGASDTTGTVPVPEPEEPEEVCEDPMDTHMHEGLEKDDESDVCEKPPKCPKVAAAPEKPKESVTKKRAPAKPLSEKRGSQHKKAKTEKEDLKTEDDQAHVFFINVPVGFTLHETHIICNMISCFVDFIRVAFEKNLIFCKRLSTMLITDHFNCLSLGHSQEKNQDKAEMAESTEGTPAGESVKPATAKPRSQPSDEAMCKACTLTCCT